MVQSETIAQTSAVSQPAKAAPSASTLQQQLAIREAKSVARINHLRRIQQNVEDLLSLSNAEHCAQSTGMANTPLKQQYNSEVQRLLNDLGKLIKPSQSQQSAASATPAPASTKHRPGTSQVQLRLSQDLARILVAFAKAGRRPSVVVEAAMWKDSQFRDAAEILGINAPALPAPQKKLRRIQPVRPL